jgi:hypothetical protein
MQTFLKNKNLKLVLFLSLLIIPLLIFIPETQTLIKFENEETDLTTSLSKEFTKTIKTSADTSVDESNPDWTNGSATSLMLSGYSEREGTIYGEDWCYFQFEVDSSLGNFKSAAVQFSFYPIYEDAIIAVHTTSNEWDESTLTWNNRPAKGDYLGKFYVPHTINAQYITVDVSDAFSDTKNEASLILSYYDKTNTTGSGMKVSAKEGSGYEAELYYTYEVEVSIDIVAPTSNTTWTFGNNQVGWSASAIIEEFDIELYKGNSKVKTLDYNVDNNGNMGVTIPIMKDDALTITTGDNYKVKLIDSDDPSISKFSPEFSIDTTIDSSKGSLIGMYDDYVETFNAEADANYFFSYKFTNKQDYYLTISDQDGTVLHEEEIDSKTGSFKFKSDKTEVLIIRISTDGPYGYIKLNYTEQAAISGYSILLLSLISIIGLTAVIFNLRKRFNF